ncbi:MAG TPA: hypothetical protein DCP90_06110 [Clostridiales bacterium]|nr:MAG: hypothetical protein A2Y22_09190 [Clostridiales bacterium GWD2_32_59]HAN10168.1 hypothetical protein [Clostridiales bacterium]
MATDIEQNVIEMKEIFGEPKDSCDMAEMKKARNFFIGLLIKDGNLTNQQLVESVASYARLLAKSEDEKTPEETIDETIICASGLAYLTGTCVFLGAEKIEIRHKDAVADLFPVIVKEVTDPVQTSSQADTLDSVVPVFELFE